MPENNIDTIMNRITKADFPVDVYRVSVYKNDYSTAFTAVAVLRGSESKSYSAGGNTTVSAILELEKVLRSLVCPTCGKQAD